MSKATDAKNYFLSGYNCAQAVAIAFSDMVDLDEKTIAKCVCGYGGGMGRLREVCGAFSGAVFILSLLYGYDDSNAYEEKKQIYSDIQQLAQMCKDANGSIICRELLGIDKKAQCSPVPQERTQEYYKKRPCAEIVYTCAECLEKFIENKNSSTA